MDSVLVWVIFFYLVINTYPTMKTLNHSELSGLQRLFRILFVWLVPFFGGLIVSLNYVIHPAHRGGPYDVGSGDYSNNGSGDLGD